MLSVILPNYNHGALIPRALSALLGQDLLPIEIIVIDDASTDDSPAIIKTIRGAGYMFIPAVTRG